jgi:hypothetical protein
MAFAIRRKTDNLFYNRSTFSWVLLEKARIFKRISDLNSFLRVNDNNGTGLPYSVGKYVEGVSYPEINYALKNNYEIVEVKLVVV